MIKYISENSQFNKNYIQQSDNINYFGLSSSVFEKDWKSFTPYDMNNHITDDDKFKTYQDNNLPVYRLFNHNQQLDFGKFTDSNRQRNIYFQLSEKKCLKALKVNLHNSNRPFNLKLQASFDKKIWKDIDTYKIGSSTTNQNLDDSLLFINQNGGDNLIGSFVLICKFHNNKKYKYYKLILSTVDYYYDYGIKMSKMFLYDQDGIKSNFIYFPFNDNNQAYNQNVYGELYNVWFEEGAAVFNNNSHIKYNPSFPYLIGNCSINFKANLLGDKLKGTLISKGYKNYYYDNGYTFDFKCEEFDFQNNSPLTFISLENNSTFCFCYQHNQFVGEMIYSLDDGKTWNKYNVKNINDQKKQIIVLNKDKKLIFFNIKNNLSSYCHFILTGKFNLSGDLSSLMKYEKSMKYNEQFYGLFRDNNSIYDASKLVLSFKNITYNGYAYMFSKCNNLIKSPKIVNFQYTDSYSFYRMFEECKNLKQIHTEFDSWRSSVFGNWVQGVSNEGVFIKSSNLSEIRGNSNIPNNWQIIDSFGYEDESNKYIYPNAILFTINTKFYSNAFMMFSSQIKNNFHLYSFTFGKKYDKVYVDGIQKSVFQYDEEKQLNEVFNSGTNMPLTLGCQSYEQDYYNGQYQMKNHISNMKLKQLSFYDYELTGAQIKNIMNKE